MPASSRRISAIWLAALIAAGGATGLPSGSAEAFESTVRADTHDRQEDRDRLFGALARAGSETEAKAMEREIWAFWLQAPDEAAATLMNQALERRGAYDLAAAHETLTRLVDVAPDWAEAWNQRATIRFMQGDTEGSLLDIEETLRREPQHFGALAGQAVILMRQGRFRTGQSILRKAVSIHPYLAERRMIQPLPGEGEAEGRKI